MKYLITFIILAALLVAPASALELSPPPVPESGAELMPERAETFGQGLMELLRDGIGVFLPNLAEAIRLCTSVCITALLLSVVENISEGAKVPCQIAGVAAITGILLRDTTSLIRLGVDAVTEMGEYGKLLLPVMTTALAAQGGIQSSTTLYAGTTVFTGLLSAAIVSVLIPLIYFYLILSTANATVGESVLKKIRDFIKWLMTWSLKIILYVFTSYMGITGVISGTTDAAAMKATKLTISGMVPVVGGILSDASEAVLVSAGVVKNAAGIYGIFAVLAICLGPFLQIGAHYLILKITAGICELIGPKRAADLVNDISGAMGMVLAMTGSVCLMLLISIVCFLKGVQV